MQYFTPGQVKPLIDESSELIAIFTATTKKNGGENGAKSVIKE